MKMGDLTDSNNNKKRKREEGSTMGDDIGDGIVVIRPSPDAYTVLRFEMLVTSPDGKRREAVRLTASEESSFVHYNAYEDLFRAFAVNEWGEHGLPKGLRTSPWWHGRWRGWTPLMRLYTTNADEDIRDVTPLFMAYLAEAHTRGCDKKECFALSVVPRFVDPELLREEEFGMCIEGLVQRGLALAEKVAKETEDSTEEGDEETEEEDEEDEEERAPSGLLASLAKRGP